MTYSAIGENSIGGTTAGTAPARGKLRVVLTSEGTGDRLSRQPDVALLDAREGAADGVLRIHRDRQRQGIVGFGGSFTEAAAHTLSRLSPELRDQVLDAYFHPERGSGYTLCRTHINSCDFSLGNYAYAERAGDHELEHFTIERDRSLLLPMIKDAVSRMRPGSLRLLASPWSPPAWMKTNGEMNRGGHLRPECRDAWALYFAKYITAYAEEGIPIWGVTVQNEPRAVQAWDSCIYSHAEQRDFVRDHLGPSLAAHGLGGVRILVWDHNKDEIVECADAILSDPETARYVWGVGFHWYGGDAFENLDEVHRRFPDKHLLFTEGCQEGGVTLGSWDLGERYGHAVIGDLNHWATGWIDWNMVLNTQGGPNHVGNYCDAPIIADTENNRVHYQSAYYYLAHFSRFFLPGSTILETRLTGSAPGVEATACRRPDGSLSVVVMNTDEDGRAIQIDDAGRYATVELPGHAIATLLFA